MVMYLCISVEVVKKAVAALSFKTSGEEKCNKCPFTFTFLK